MKIKIRSIIYLLVVSLAVIPLSNRLLTHAGVDRFSFNFKTLFLEYLFVVVLLFIILILHSRYKKSVYHPKIRMIVIFAVLVVLGTLFSVVLSWDITRSIYLFMFGTIGPILLFGIIAFYTDATVKTLDLVYKGFLHSCILYLIVSFLFAFRTVSFSSGIDLLEFRMGGNIYGSNAVIGAIAFILPLIFTRNGYQIQNFQKKDIYLKLFTVLSIVWIILSISRWGYATMFMTYLLTVLLIEKKVNYKVLVGVTVAFILASFFLGNIFQVIIDRFTGGGALKLESVYEYTQEETRFVRWANAVLYIKENLSFGIGLGNNYLIDVRQSPGAHNLLINFTVERGVITLGFLFGLIFSVMSLGKKIQKRSSNSVLKKQAKVLTIGIFVFFFWSFTAGSFVQSGGIISAVKAYYFMVSIGILVLISRVDSELNKSRWLVKHER